MAKLFSNMCAGYAAALKSGSGVPFHSLAGVPQVRLSRERKQLTNCIKMVAYQAESGLLALVCPDYARAAQEGRTLVTTAMQSAADIGVTQNGLWITLTLLGSPHRSKYPEKAGRLLPQ